MVNKRAGLKPLSQEEVKAGGGLSVRKGSFPVSIYGDLQ